MGVSAAAPVAVAAAPAGQAGGDAGGAEEKQNLQFIWLQPVIRK